MVTAANIEVEKAGLGINVKKIKTMVVSNHKEDNINADIHVNNVTVEQFSTFKCLGQTITQDGKNEYEIKI